jgi:hypothetical protein
MLYGIVSKIIKVKNVRNKLPILERKLQCHFSGYLESKAKQRNKLGLLDIKLGALTA